MRTFFRRFWAALAVVGCGAASALGSDPAAPPRGDGPPLPAPFVAPAPPAVLPPPGDPVKVDAPLQLPGPPPLPPPEAEGDAAHGPGCQPGFGLFADVEYLYLKAYRRSLDYAIVSPNTNFDPEGAIQSDPWHSRSAFRVGLGYRMPDSGLEVGFFYTYLHAEDLGLLARPAAGLLFTTQTHPGTVEFATTARADAILSYNVFDLEAGRRMEMGDSFEVRPFGGLRFAQINQNFGVVYDGGDANRDRVGSQVNFDGGGLRAGAQVDWKLLEHFRVYGRAAGSLMTGDFNVRQTEFNNNGATPLTNVTESFRKIVPVVEMGAGVAYQREHVRLSFGYEITDWFNLVDSPSFVNDVHQGKYQRNTSDLGIDGLAVKAEFTY